MPVELPFKENDGGAGAYHIFPLLLPKSADRAAFMKGLRDVGVQSSNHYRPIDTFSYYAGRYGVQSLPIIETVVQREVNLPLYPTKTEVQLELVLEYVRKLVESSEKLRAERKK